MSVLILVPIFTGLVLSLLVNYLADVLPITRQFSRPVCMQCGQVYSPIDYLLFKACGQCNRRRSFRSWLTPVIIIAISIYLWSDPPARIDGYAVSMAVVAYFGLIFVVDVEHRLILHPTSIFGAVLGLGVGWMNYGLYQTLLGGAGGLLFMLALYGFGVLFARWRARKMSQTGQPADDEEALGFGDVTLAGVLGLLLSWRLIWFGLLFGILLAGAFALLMVVFMLVIRKYKENVLMVFMPYGPFLILSAFFLLFLPNWVASIVPK
jgi:leader peptidase (prepilin peptidase)/N-methyltransferase